MTAGGQRILRRRYPSTQISCCVTICAPLCVLTAKSLILNLPTNYAATGTGPYTVSQIQGVAAIGSTGYSTLKAAFTAANSKTGNITIDVLQDCSVTGSATSASAGNNIAITVNKNITLRLNGHTVTNSLPWCRMFRLNSGRTFTIDGTTPGSEIVIPSSNRGSFGFVDMLNSATNGNARLVLNGGTYTGAVTYGSMFRTTRNSQTIEMTGCTFNLLYGGGNVSSPSGINGYQTLIDTDTYSDTINLTDCVINDSSPAGNDQSFINCESSRVTMTKVTLNSQNLTGYASIGNNSVITDCNIAFNNSNYFSGNSYMGVRRNSIFSISGGNSVRIDSGTYSGYWGLHIMTTGGTFNVYGGEFTNSDYVLYSAIKATDSGSSNFNVYGGTFNGRIYLMSKNSHLTIYGGYFNRGNKSSFFGTVGDSSSVKIYGGYFTDDPIAYVQSGYVVVSETYVKDNVTYNYHVVAESE